MYKFSKEEKDNDLKKLNIKLNYYKASLDEIKILKNNNEGNTKTAFISLYLEFSKKINDLEKQIKLLSK